jgi:hypothetical protein
MSECPRCQAPLPDPEARFCTNCGAPLLPEGSPSVPTRAEADSEPLPVIALPSPPAPEEPHPRSESPQGTPWDRRGEIGLGAALIETSREVILRPAAFYRTMPVSGGLGGPLLYGVIVGYVGLVAAVLYDFVFRTVMGGSFGRFGGNPELEKLLSMAPSWVAVVVQIVIGPALVALFLFIYSGVVHVMLTLLGGARRDFEATFRVAAYAQATQLLQVVLGIVPCCGAVLVLVYRIVVTSIGLSEVHGVSRGKAAAAILIPMLVVFCCAGLAIGILMWAAIRALGGTQ